MSPPLPNSQSLHVREPVARIRAALTVSTSKEYLHGGLKIRMSAIPKKGLRDRVPEAPIVILAKQPNMDGRTLTIQNYHVNGELVIPLFSSMAALQESTQGADLGSPAWAINRDLLVSVLHGDEVFLLDPKLQSELRFTAMEFRQAFPEL